MDMPAQLVIGWNLLCWLIAGIPILTTVGVYILARFTSVFDAYSGERAKLMAQFHNLDKLVEQTQALTVTTEAINAQVSGDEWLKQQRWSKLCEAYEEAKASIDDLRAAATLLASAIRRCIDLGPSLS